MNFKKAVYIFLTMVLGGLLGCLAYGLTTLISPKAMAFSTILFDILILAGIISGFFLGFRWWRIVYVEHRHWRWKRRNNNKQ